MVWPQRRLFDAVCFVCEFYFPKYGFCTVLCSLAWADALVTSSGKGGRAVLESGRFVDFIGNLYGKAVACVPRPETAPSKEASQHSSTFPVQHEWEERSTTTKLGYARRLGRRGYWIILALQLLSTNFNLRNLMKDRIVLAPNEQW
jgi:hypothetical protein